MEKNEFLSGVNNLIKENRQIYSNYPKHIIRDYNLENESVKEYNGRQILELLQNADDASSKAVDIKFDKDAFKLSIANIGEPFSIQGIESLMLAHLSAKTKKIFIGNKGLGFRSILNWANKICIRTNGCVVEFSPEIAKTEFELAVKTGAAKTNLLAERGLAEKTIPFPILAIPKIDIDESSHNVWTTIIEIYYKKEFESSIEAQLADCREEILLFLNNIETISIDGLASEQISYSRLRLKENDLTYIQIKNKVWRIETVEDYLPSELQDESKTEKESFNITVAFQDDLSDKYYKLFNFFPTKLSIYLPCVIHATFELNSSRDYINDSEKNKFIFEQLVELLKKCSLNLIEETEGKADWSPFKLLLPLSDKTDSTLIETFYSNLKNLHNELKVFPCVDGNYECLNKIKYYDPGFSEWVKNNDFANQFKSLLSPLEESIEKTYPVVMRSYSQIEFTSIIDNISNKIDDLKVRSELIAYLLQISTNQNRNERYSILVNKGKEVINKTKVAFTPMIESEGEFKKPDFIDLDFINKDLYNTLVLKYKKGFNQKEPDSREFQRLFSRIANIQPYDSNAVIIRIINGTKEQIKTESDVDAISHVKQMVQTLFENYQMLKNKAAVFSESCPLINKQNEIIDSRSLYLSVSFPSGKLIKDIYGNVLSDADYLKDIAFYDLNCDDNEIIESFFIWLGVTKYVQLNDIRIAKEYYESDPYLDFVFTKIRRPNPVSRFNFAGKEIGSFFKTLSKLSNEKLVMLVLKDERLRQSVLGLNSSDLLYYQYGQNYPNLFGFPSYVLFQLRSLNRFNKYLIESSEIPFINEQEFNYDDPLFKEYGISYHEIDYVLEKLGALRSFVDLPTERVYEIIKMCADLKTEHKYIRRLYLQAFDHFRSPKMKPSVEMRPDTRLLAIKNGSKDYRPIEEVYYSDNNILPEKIIQDLWMLDFPKRAGEVQVSKYFGIKTLKELQISIDTLSIADHVQNAPFNEWVKQIKPLILAFRLSNLKKQEDKKEAAKAIKNCIIRLISNVNYTTDGKIFQKLGYEEFIVNDDQFLMSVEGFKNVEQFRDSSKFCNAFAEMMCILFKVNENKNNYISVFKDKIDFSRELIHADSLDEYLSEAYTLLGLSQNETVFWNAVCKIKSIQFPDDIQDELSLRQFLHKNLRYELPVDYKLIDFENHGSSKSYNLFKSLQIDINITLSQIKAQLPSFAGLIEWHVNRITDCSRDMENRYSNAIWQDLNSKTIADKKTFIYKRNKFRYWFANYKWSELELPPFTLDINYKEILETKAVAEFKIQLSENENPIVIRPEYKELLAKYEEIEKSFSDEQRSLLYFEGNLAEILKFIIVTPAEADKQKEEEDDDENDNLPLVEKNLANNIPTGIKPRTHSRGGSVDPNREKAKRQAGKKAEENVRDTLIGLYGRKNVQWVSGNSDEDKPDDSLGYDFLYRKTDVDEWCFLEVKSVTGSSFIISNNEFKVALDNKEKYHLALVKTEEIIIDKDFFKNIELENTYNSFNSSTLMRPYDFEVFFS